MEGIRWMIIHHDSSSNLENKMFFATGWKFGGIIVSFHKSNPIFEEGFARIVARSKIT